MEAPTNDRIDRSGQSHGTENIMRDISLVGALLESTTQQSMKIVATLTEFANHLHVLEESSKAVNEDTQKLKNIHSNIDSALRSVGKVLDMFAIAGKLDAKMRAGPTTGNLTDFFSQMDKLAEAEAFLKEHRSFLSASDALSQLSEVRAAAITACEQYFVNLIRKSSSAIDPSKTVAAGEEPLGSIDPRVTTEMKRIVLKLAENSKVCTTEYGNYRAKFLLGSLSKLSPDKLSLTFLANPVKLATYTRGSHPFVEFLKISLDLVKKERDIAEDVLGNKADESWPQTVSPTLKFISETFEGTLKSLRGIGGTFGLLVATDLHNEWLKMIPEFDSGVTLLSSGRKLGSSNNNPLLSDMAESGRKIEAGICKWFAEFEEGLLSETLETSPVPITPTNASGYSQPQNFSSSSSSSSSSAKRVIPIDGTVHEITAFTISFLKRAVEYKDIIDEFMTKLALMQKVARSDVKGVSGTGNFILRCLNSLQSSLEAKAKREKVASLAIVFLLNNFNYIVKGIKAMQEALGPGFVTKLAKFQSLLDTQKAAFVSTWNKALEAAKLDNPAEKNITKKSYIKSKFNAINKEVEELFNSQRRYSVPDSELRDELRNAIAGPLVQEYTNCVSRYQDVPFTTHRTKYIRYSPETLKGMLMALFEGITTVQK